MLNFLEPSAAQPTKDEILGIRKMSEQPLDRYLLNVDKLVETESESTEAKIRAQTIVQMCRRYRGATPSDLFGFWRNGTWAEHPKFSQLHGTNVFQALIHGAESGFCQARIGIDVSAKSNNFQNRAVEKIARSVYEILDGTQWNSNTEQSVFFSAILKLNAFIISRFNKAGGPELSVPEFSPVAYEQGGMWVCPECFEYGEGVVEACPACGSPVSPVQDPEQMQDQLVSSFGKQPAGEVETIVSDALDVSVDDRNGKCAEISECGWVQWRYFANKAELKKLYPHLKLNSKAKWSYTTRLKVALKRYESGEASPKTEFDKQKYEVKQTWLDRAEYEDYISPEDYTCGNHFSIKAGQKLTDVCPDGLVMGVVNDEIAFIDNENKNKRIKSCVWLADPSSFYGVGARAGLPIQKKINQLDNMAMEGEARSMKGSVVYVPEAVDGANLEGANTNIPLKPDFATGGEPIKNFIMPLEISGLSAASLSFLGSQVDTMQKVMGVPNVTLGEGDSTVQTATGATLVNQRASGLLVPAKKSEGDMKAGWLKDQLDLIQTYYSPEALLAYGSRYGKEFLEDEINAFFSCKLDDAITIEIVDGSEIPETRSDKQMKLRNDIAAGFIPLTPELQMKLAQQSGYDGIDVNYYESNCKLAEKRMAFVKENYYQPEVEMQYQQAEAMLTDPKTGQRLTDEMGNKVPNPITQMAISNPALKPNAQAENHEQQFQYWAGMTRELLASGSQVPMIVVDICDAMMSAHKFAAFAEQTKAQTLMGISTMPVQMGGALAAQSVAPPEPKNNSEKSSKKT